MKFLIITLLFFIPCLAFAQGGDNDDWLNPKPKVDSTAHKPMKPKPPQPLCAGCGKIKQYEPIILSNFAPGGYVHSNLEIFCQKILNQIEDTEDKNNKIININIKGYADGLINKGVAVEKEKIAPECIKYISEKQGLEDIGLATLRACQVEQKLRTLLKGKSYYISVRLKQDYYDEPDGGKQGGDYRKVEVQITYLEKEK